MKNTATPTGFDFFWSEPGRQTITALKQKYSDNECGPEERVIAARFLEADTFSLNKIIKAIQLEQQGVVSGTLLFDPIESIMIKPVSDVCNLSCTYCYEGEGKNRYSTAVMSDETLERVIEQAFVNAQAHLTFLWHGGEPTLAGIEFFKKACAFQQRFNKKAIRISNIIQTNGLTLNTEWIDFFQGNDFSVGFSLDGTKAINDLQRVDHRGEGSYDRVLASVKLMQSKKVGFGIITVVNQSHKGKAKEIFDLFISEGILNFDIHPGYGSYFQLPPLEFAEFVIDLFDAWLKEGNPAVHISIFDEIFKVMSGDHPSTCYFAGTCTKIFAVESDGNIVPCTRPFDRKKYTFGNIKQQQLADILTGEKHSDFKITDKTSQANSEECPWYAMCHNGCPQQRSKNGKSDIAGSNLYCKCQSGQAGGYYAIWAHITSTISNILSATSANTGATTSTLFASESRLFL